VLEKGLKAVASANLLKSCEENNFQLGVINQKSVL